MNGLVAACGLILLALVLSLVLKKDAPVIAFLLTLTAGVLILLHALALAGSAAQQFSALLAQGGITDSLDVYKRQVHMRSRGRRRGMISRVSGPPMRTISTARFPVPGT